MSGIMIPVIIHFAIINMVQMMRLHVDAASLTTMAACFSLPVFVWMMREDAGRYDRLSICKKGLPVKGIAEILVLALGFNLLLTPGVNAIAAWLHLSNESQDALFGSGLWVQLIGIGILVPIQEEVLFRGLVYQRLKAYNKSWFSVIFAAAFFAVYHGNMIQIIFAFPMAILIIWLYERWEVLLAPILFHIVVNISSILISAGKG